MEKKNCNGIKRAITVYVPGNVCNLRCSYCYVSECLRDGHEEVGYFNYSVGQNDYMMISTIDYDIKLYYPVNRSSSIR